jgi:hypothetical protein
VVSQFKRYRVEISVYDAASQLEQLEQRGLMLEQYRREGLCYVVPDGTGAIVAGEASAV